jgi:hypothetical protein
MVKMYVEEEEEWVDIVVGSAREKRGICPFHIQERIGGSLPDPAACWTVQLYAVLEQA